MRGRSNRLAGLIVGLMSVFVSVQLSFAAGFALYEGSARGNALGGTMVGRADDASALFYNPAGITQLPGVQIMTGATFIVPSTKVRTTFPDGSSKTTSTDTNVWIPPQLYTTYQVNDQLWLGLGVFSPFGLGTEFPQDWPGRYNNVLAKIQTMDINPNIAFKVTDHFSLAAGMDFVYFDLTLKNKIDPLGLNTPAFDIGNSLKGDTWGYGFNFAAHYKPFDWLACGISYRSQVKEHVDGDADFTIPQSVLNTPYGPYVQALFKDTSASGSITLPDEIFMGVMFKPTNRLSVEVGGTYTRWSTYKELQITYTGPLGTQTRIKDWHNAWRAQLGIEYQALDWLALRAGYVFDESPIDNAHADYIVPANDRHLFSFGPGFKWHNFTLDLSYTYILIEDRNNVPAQPDGVYASKFEDGNASLFGVTVGYKF